MSISLAKALLGILSVGASGIGVYGVYRLVSKTSVKTIEQLLEENKEIALLDVEGTADNLTWDQKVSELENNTTSSVLDSYTAEEGDTTDVKRSKIQKICRGLFLVDSKEQSKLNQAKKWCTKSVTASL